MSPPVQARPAIAIAIARAARLPAVRLPAPRDTLLAAGALAIGAAIWLHAAGPGSRAGYDFFQAYLPGAKAVAAGVNPYHQLVQQVADTRPGAEGFHAHGYVYPPLLALALALPVRLGLSDGVIWPLWNLAIAVAVLWMGRELSLALRGRADWAGSLAFASATLLGAIATYDLSLGQADVLIAALMVGACGLWLRRSPWAALALGVAIAIKPTAALLLVIWLWKGDWRAALRGALAAVALILVPFALLAPGTLGDYVTFFTRWNAFQANAEYINQSPYGMLLRAFAANAYTHPLIDLPWLVAPLRALVLLGAALWWARAVPRRRTADRALALGECLLAFPLILLFSPLTEDIHFCVLLPALVGLGWLALSRGLARRPATWALLAAFALSCVPRFQELIYPDHLLALPGQSDPRLGPVIALARTGVLLYVALAALLAGGVALRAARGVACAATADASPQAAAPDSAGVAGAPA